MIATQLFREGKLAAAIEAQTADVKGKPSDVAARTFLFELLCFAGQLERAQKHLDTIEQLAAASVQAVQVYRNILHAELLRRKLFAEGLTPGFLMDPPPHVTPYLDAIVLLAQDREEAAAQMLRSAEEQRPLSAGEYDGGGFTDMRDCDDRMAAIIEIIVIRDYIWLPVAQIRSLRIHPPERPRDIIWPSISIVLSNESSLSGYSPALYPQSHEQDDDALALGRRTDWDTRTNGLTFGLGQRMLLVGDEAVPYLSAGEILFSP